MKNRKKKIGFTLIELLAVIIVLAIIALIATPIIFNVIENAKIKSLENSCYGVIDAVRTKYAEELLNLNKITNGNVNELTISGEKPIDGTWTIDNSKDSEQRGIKIDNVRFSSMKDYACSNDLETGKVSCKKTYKDNSSANTPILFKNMVPIKYENNKWIIADLGQKWYDYDAKEWANAVVLNSGVTKNVGDEVTEEEISLWYVWIPRYKYTIFNGNNGSVSEQLINVTFESGISRTGTVTCSDNADGSETCSTITNGTSTYTHPAFKFGNTELTGFWVGKFEVSGSTSAITVKPNVTSLRSQTVSSLFTAIQNVKTTYGINNADSHMLKNMEWGAVAYLKQSKYGLGTTDIAINDNSSYYTGGGTSDAYKTNVAQSTTGNIYGVYDMSGGAFEYVMGNMNNSSNAFYSSNSGFTTAPDAKYYDSYKYDSSSYTSHARGKLGDATKETLTTFGNNSGGWYSDYAFFPSSILSWFVRGGGYTFSANAGVFDFDYRTGRTDGNGSARAVLSAQ
jgi:prepilin-type N-terminal cleavage/methylation domain-containing protein